MTLINPSRNYNHFYKRTSDLITQNTNINKIVKLNELASPLLLTGTHAMRFHSAAFERYHISFVAVIRIHIRQPPPLLQTPGDIL